MDQSFKFTLSQLKNIAWCFYTDLLHVHWHSTGKFFSDIHILAKEYYEKAYDDVDYFAEKAMSKGENVTNGALIANDVGAEVWQPEVSTAYDVDNFIDFLHSKGNDYIEALRNCACEDTDVKSDIDTMLTFWTSEIQYKNEQRSKENGGMAIEQINEPSYDPPLVYSEDFEQPAMEVGDNLPGLGVVV